MLQAIAHTEPEIERLLALGVPAVTDNEDALHHLGFCRSYPQVRDGYEATIYERSMDGGYRETSLGLRRVMVAQRAFLKRT